MSWCTVPTEKTHPRLSLEKNLGEGFYIFVYENEQIPAASKVIPVSDDLFEAITQFEVACNVADALLS